MKKKRDYIYSNKKHTLKGIFSTVLAAISFFTQVFLTVMSYTKHGEISESFGATAFMCTLFSGIGILVGLAGKKDFDCYYVFANVGICWNVLNLFISSAFLYAGI